MADGEMHGPSGTQRPGARWRLAGVVLTAVVIAFVVYGPFDQDKARPTTSSQQTGVDRAVPVRQTPSAIAMSHAPPPRALRAVAELVVKGRAAKTGYSRDAFGPAWADADRNGCDTRNDILKRDLTDVTLEPGTYGCVVLSGTLHDPYTGALIEFTRGFTTSAKVQIDHVVSLSDAWQKGAQGWVIRKRMAFANDPLNLLAVAGSANEQKGDGDTATWLPARASRCSYVARQVAVKRKYQIWVTAAEAEAMRSILADCPDATLPDSDAPTLAPIRPPASTGSTDAHRLSPDGQGAFENCDAARAAQAAPLHRGDPGYAEHLDGDGDGIACE